MTNFLCEWAQAHNLEFKTDSIGNVNIIREASKGKEKVPTIVIQCHQDMVCEKNAGVEFDFTTDPIKWVIEDGWMIAPDTTLGADDGIGIATCLALLESKLEMGRIECVFTISEETGMFGAEAMQEGFFTGKTLINIDSEDEGQLFIGCAGGVRTNAMFDFDIEAVNPGYSRVKLTLGGAIGGHSGDDINKERVNTVQQMARFLYGELNNGMQLISFTGGGKSNSIARECEAVIATANPFAVIGRFTSFGETLKAEYAVTDPDVFGTAVKIDNDSPAVCSKVATALISSMFACPHGVQAMSQDIKDLVETSTNLAAITMEDNRFTVITSQRSSTMSERDMIADKVEATFRLAGAEVVHEFPYPGWKPNVKSKILDVCIKSYRKLFKTQPEVKAIHAGLECGLFLEKFPGLDMISFGPTLRGVHAPGERIELSSIDKFVDLLADVVCNFK